MWTLLIGIVLGVRTTKGIPQYQYYPIPVNIDQYPITQYQYRSHPNTQTIGDAAWYDWLWLQTDVEETSHCVY